MTKSFSETNLHDLTLQDYNKQHGVLLQKIVIAVCNLICVSIDARKFSTW